MTILRTVVPALVLMLAMCGVAAAQPVAESASVAVPASEPPRLMFEGAGGWTGFADDSVIHHSLIGLAARYSLTRRISVGPELQHMVGPGFDRDTLLTGNIVVDLLAPTPTRPRPTTPYLVVGGGLLRHTARYRSSVASRPFTRTYGAATLGVGLRGWVSRRVFVGADARLGLAPHLRLAGLVGVAF